MTASNLLLALLILALIVAVPVWLFRPGGTLRGYLGLRRRRRERALWEDILRQVLQMEQDGRTATAESIAGSLGRPVSELRRVFGRMAERDLVDLCTPKLRLTSDGKRWAMHVLRAHRLWESYLADEARLPMGRIHHQAELAEHHLTEGDLAALDAHLGHPIEDPHGDPIPTAQGELALPRGTALPQWEGGEFVQVVHVEDEPAEIFNRLLTKGIRPGVCLRIHSLNQSSLDVWLDGALVSIEQDLLPNIEVAEDTDIITKDPQVTRLSQLVTGESAEIVALSEAIRGFSRRRLLDFGVTKGTRIAPVLDNPFGDPRAFRIRGTTIGIRNEQAREIWVRRSRSLATDGGVRA